MWLSQEGNKRLLDIFERRIYHVEGLVTDLILKLQKE